MDFSCYEYKNKYLQNQKTPINNYEGYKVVGAGIEPARTQCPQDFKSCGHVKSCVNSPEPSGKAKYNKRPIAYKYCEGKVKRTSNRGVK